MRMLDLEVVSMKGGRDNRLLEEPLPFDKETRVVNDDDFEGEP
jgi:hypothetical protein